MIDISNLISLGNQLSEAEVRKLEGGLKGNPADVASRVKLLGYYFTRYNRSTHARTRRKEHIFWMLEHMSDHPLLGEPFAIILKSDEDDSYIVFRRMWLTQVRKHRDSARVLANAASALAYSDLRKSKKLLSKALELGSDDPEIIAMEKRLNDMETPLPRSISGRTGKS